LAAERQASSVPDSAVTAEIHEALDIHRNFAAQVTLDLEIRDCRTEFRHFRLRQVLDLNRGIDAGRRTDLLRPRPADAIDRRQRNHDVLVQRYVYSSYACHKNIPLRLAGAGSTLALLVPGILADHAHNSVAADDLAVPADFLDRCSYFHGMSLRPPNQRTCPPLP